jgi:beta-phosphoglucomutase-like phosphatase (HAD superfamily)
MGANSPEWAEIMRTRLRLEHLDADVIQEAIVDGVVERYRTLPSPVIAGAPAQVRRIAAGRPVAIASSSHRRVIEAAIDALGLHDVFAAVVSSDEVARGKPAPDVYLLAAERLGVDARRCLVVEDSLNGVRSGKAAGAYVVLVPNPSVPPAGDARERADLVLERLDDLDPDRLPA